MKILLKNGEIVNYDGITNASILIEDSIIKNIIKQKDLDKLVESYDGIIDCSDCYILPGVIDPHVHLRDMEQSYKETIESGTKTAIQNGVTTILAMPNTNPRLSTPDSIQRYIDLISNTAHSGVGVYGNVHDGFELEMLEKMKKQGILGLKIYPGDTSPNFKLNWEPIVEIERLFRKYYNEESINISKIYTEFENLFLDPNYFNNFKENCKNWIGLIKKAFALKIDLLFHPDIPLDKDYRCKLFEDHNKNGRNELKAHAYAYNKIQELLFILFIFKLIGTSIDKDAKNMDENDYDVKFCHLSCPESVELIDLLVKKMDLKIQVEKEITPHHLFLNTEIKLSNPSIGKVLQPLRDVNDNVLLQKYLSQERLSYIGTDHAPHTVEEKTKPFLDAMSGFGALDFYVPYFITQILNGFLSLTEFVKYSSYNIAQSFHIKNKGKLDKYYDADMLIVKKTEPYSITVNSFLSMSKITPYELKNLRVKIMQVFLGGKLVVNNDPSLVEKYPRLNKYINLRCGTFIKKYGD